MAIRASTISGTSSVSGASDPATRAARTNVVRCPASTTTEEITTPGQLPRASSPRRASRSAPRTAPRRRPATGAAWRRRRTATTARSDRTPTAASTHAAVGPPISRPVCSRAGEGWASRIATPTAISTTWPATRSSTTARTPRPTSPESRPCRTARCTSPRTPPGSAALRNSAR
ncbi:hypothetical protein GWI24_14040 [Streptomyces sp. MK37H]|nr:hypothetical protein [Streptomyces sp. MK37H]